MSAAVNSRLRAALLAAGMRYDALARELGVDAKTVERWVSQGKTPYPRHAHAAAKALDADAYFLWPDLDARMRAKPAPRDEVVACYPSRGAVPPGLWRTLLAAATSHIDLSVADALFLLDTVPDLVELLAERACAGVRVRLALPDPDAAASPVDAARAALAEEAFTGLYQAPGVRLTGHAGVTNDVLRADDDLLVATRVDGCAAVAAPVLHLRRIGQAPLTGIYLTGLEHVFATSAPKRAPQRTAVAA